MSDSYAQRNAAREDLLAKCRLEHDAGDALEPGERLALMHANAQALRTLQGILVEGNRS